MWHNMFSVSELAINPYLPCPKAEKLAFEKLRFVKEPWLSIVAAPEQYPSDK
jgi:hypothetical protein